MKKTGVIFLLISFWSFFLSAQDYSSNPIFPSFSTGGSSDNGVQDIEMNCQIIGNSGIFKIEFVYPMTFDAGIVYLKEDSPNGTDIAQVNTSNFPNSVTFSLTFTHDGTKIFYARFVKSSNNYATWTGGIQVTKAATPGKPDAPSGFTVTLMQTNDQIRLNWNDVAGETSYKIYRKEGSGNMEFYASKNANSNEYFDNSISPQTTYCYQVEACNSYGCNSTNILCVSSRSNTPNIPIGFNVTVANDGSDLRIGWADVMNETGYEIHRSINGSAYSLFTTTSSNVEFIFDYGVTKDVQYCYKVQACNGSDCSDFTSPDCETVIDPPVTPSNFSVTLNTENNPVLIWSDVQNEHFYRLYRKAPDENWHTLASPTANTISFTDESVEPGITYLYRMQACNSQCSDYTPELSIDIPGLPPYITLTNPTAGNSHNSNDILNITWETGNGFTGDVQIKYSFGLGWNFITSGTANDQTYEWTVPVVTEPKYEARIDVCSVDDPTIGYTSNFFSVLPTGITACTFNDISPDHWAYPATQYLCQEGILDDDGNIEPANYINKAAIAKLAYLSIGLNINSVVNHVKNFPTPYNDLQTEITDENAPWYNGWYYTYAKTLYYLEYDNGIPAMNRGKFNFYPASEMSREEVVKVLLETWDIDLNATTNLPFTDVSQISPEYLEYLKKAYELGIIQGDDQTNTFRPRDKALRAEVFVMLYRLMTSSSVTKPVPTIDDFYIPGSFTVGNLSQTAGGSEGNFPWGETSFSIPGIGLPLVFAHSYNSFLTELPNEFFKLRPLGHGWTHSYNAYIMEIEGDGTNSPDMLSVFWPDGTLHFYNAQTLSPVTLGVYDNLIRINATKYEIRTKGQISYIFEKLSGTASEFPYVLTSVKDRNGNTISLQYEMSEAAGDWRRLRKVQGTAGRILSFSYHSGCDLLKKVTDPMGRTVFFDYTTHNGHYTNINADLISYTNPLGDLTQYHYDTQSDYDHLLVNITLPKGNKIDNTYEKRKLKSTKNEISGSTTTFNPNPNNFLIGDDYQVEVQHPNEIINQTFDGNRQLTNSSANLGNVNVTYDSNHPTLPASITGVDGETTYYSYDNNANVTRIDLPLGVSHLYSYNPMNDVTSYTNPLGVAINYTYSNGNLVNVQGPRGPTNISYLNNGLVSSVTNPENISVQFSYDSYGNLTKTQAPLSISSSASYDLVGRVISQSNPNGETSTFAYNTNDYLTRITNPLGFTTQFGFDKNGNKTSITNAREHVTTMQYNYYTDILESETFEGHTTSYTYFPDGRLNTYTTPNGHTFNYQYDEHERITNNGFAGFTYNSQKHDLETVTKDGKAITYTHDALHRVTAVQYDGQTVGYQYDKASNLKKLIYQDGKEVDYDYYEDNSLHTVTDWNNNTTNYNYRNDGLLTEIIYPNGIKTIYSYDEAGRNTGIKTIRTADTLLRYDFALDPSGRHLREDYAGAINQTYSVQDTTVNYTYDNANRLQQANNTAYGYDDNGNTTSKGSAVCTYDILDNLLTYNDGINSYTYEYDGLGNRRKATRNGQITKYVLNILGMSQILMETDESNNAKNYYVYGLGLISRIDANNYTRYYHNDFRGSTIALTDESQSITHKYTYGAYGEVLASEEENFNPFRFVGQHGVMFEDSTLYFMRARYYDVESGRFLSEDPIWNTNLYAYVGNDPVNSFDPLGLYISYVGMSDQNGHSIIYNENDSRATTHLVLDILGMIPGYGEPFDAINCGIYLDDKKYGDAALSCGAVIPFVGWAATATKWTKRTKIWTKGRASSSVENAYNHWKTHGHEFSELYNSKQYVESAHVFLDKSPKGTLVKYGKNGRVKKYHPATNTFGVKDKYGIPQTYFKPSNGINYWIGQ